MKKVTLIVTDKTAEALRTLCRKGYLYGKANEKWIAFDLAGYARSGDGTPGGPRRIVVDGETMYIPRRRTIHYN